MYDQGKANMYWGALERKLNKHRSLFTSTKIQQSTSQAFPSSLHLCACNLLFTPIHFRNILTYAVIVFDEYWIPILLPTFYEPKFWLGAININMTTAAWLKLIKFTNPCQKRSGLGVPIQAVPFLWNDPASSSMLRSNRQALNNFVNSNFLKQLRFKFGIIFLIVAKKYRTGFEEVSAWIRDPQQGKI